LLTLGGVAATGYESFLSTGTTTAYNYATISNTGSNLRIGIESATAVGLLTGSSNYSGVIGTLTATSLHLGTNSTVRATIDSSGNLGLGVTPSAWFSGIKAMQFGLSSSISSNTGVNQTRLNTNTYYNTSGNPIFITGSGSGYAQEYAQNASGEHTWNIASSGTAGGSISFTQAMTLNTSGNLLVGTTSPSSQTGRLEVFGSSSTAGMFKNTAGATNGWAGNFWNNDTTGNNLFVEFGTETGYTGRGSITYNRAGGLTVYNTTSDQRLKENIVDAPSALSKVNLIQIRSFDWKETGNHSDFGVIAQELDLVAPECVTQGLDNEDGSIKSPWAVDTSALVPAMIKAIQELNAKVTLLETQLAAKG
jgi:hypothetical protein